MALVVSSLSYLSPSSPVQAQMVMSALTVKVMDVMSPALSVRSSLPSTSHLRLPSRWVVPVSQAPSSMKAVSGSVEVNTSTGTSVIAWKSSLRMEMTKLMSSPSLPSEPEPVAVSLSD